VISRKSHEFCYDCSHQSRPGHGLFFQQRLHRGRGRNNFATQYAKGPAASNALTNFSLVWPGDSVYDLNPPRWGDYSGAGVDPGDTSVWIAGEYATSFPFFGALWGTAITEVTP
jgi:hypothetical protein